MKKIGKWLFILALILPAFAGCPNTGIDPLPDSPNQPVTGTAVAVEPEFVLLVPEESKKFKAIVTGTTDQRVSWKVEEGSTGGTISADGLYTAPLSTGIFHVTATSMQDSTKEATATVYVALESDYAALRVWSGTITLTVDDSLSYEQSPGNNGSIVTEYFKEEVKYANFKLHGYFYRDLPSSDWVTKIGEIVNITGSVNNKEEVFSKADGKVVLQETTVASEQLVEGDHYIKLIIYPEKGTYDLEFDGVKLNCTRSAYDYISEEWLYQDDPGTVTTFFGKVQDVRIPITFPSLYEIKHNVPILLYTEPDRYIKATISWDLKIRSLQEE